MEVGGPAIPHNMMQEGEQGEGKSAPVAQTTSFTPPFTSVLTKEQVETVEAAFLKGSQAPLETIDVDTATKLLVDLRIAFNSPELSRDWEVVQMGKGFTTITTHTHPQWRLLFICGALTRRPDVSQEQIDELMERFDVGFHGYLEKAQVLEAAEAVCGYELEKAQMYKAFRLFDRDDNGFISSDQLKAALQEGDEGLSSDELASFLRLSACKTETCFDYRKFIDQVAYAPVVVTAAPKKKKGKGKKR